MVVVVYVPILQKSYSFRVLLTKNSIAWTNWRTFVFPFQNAARTEVFLSPEALDALRWLTIRTNKNSVGPRDLYHVAAKFICQELKPLYLPAEPHSDALECEATRGKQLIWLSREKGLCTRILRKIPPFLGRICILITR